MNRLNILGIRGVPANHGGFETFAEYLCKYLVDRDWQVTVYCQEDGKGDVYESDWEGVKRIHIPVSQKGPLGTIVFDLKSVVHSLRQNGIYLTLGYNTACFSALYRIFQKKNIINMDGIEWKRQKWGKVAKAWFWFNERLGCWFGDHLVADHPKIEDHLATRVRRTKITMIPYGGLNVERVSDAVLSDYGLTANKYSIVIARPEPENSILEIVQAFSVTTTDTKLLVLGNYFDDNPYHKQVLAAASDKVIFPGAIYDADKVAALRFYARSYVHGHQVGGTNPSLVEGLAAGCAVIAHNNHFNKWVATDAAFYFSSVNSLVGYLESDYLDDDLIQEKKQAAKKNYTKRFQWKDILQQYEHLLIKYIR